MRKFGTGAAQAIWGWWDNFWQENVRDKGLGGILIGIFPFIFALVGTIIMGIIDAFVEFFKWFGGLFNSTDDDNARDLINRSSCQQLNALSDARIIEMIDAMLSGPTGDDDEQAMLKLFGCMNCDRLRNITTRVGVERIQDNFNGSEFDELQLILGNCQIIRFSDWDDDATRLFVNRSTCPQIVGLSNESLRDLINNMLSGATWDDDENAILKILRCLPCDRLSSVTNLVGVGNLQSNIDGAEFDDLQVILGLCGIVRFADWDDDATRVFVNRATCPQINALSVQNLHDLFRNLIVGFCGDDDENAINKIMRCTDCDKIRQVMNMNGTRWDDFDDAIQGSEWDDFENILASRCNIRG